MLTAARIGAAQRAALAYRWPAFVFAGAAFLALTRGEVTVMLGLAAFAAASWFFGPMILRPRSKVAAVEDPAHAEARAILGVRQGAAESEIRRAYRGKMSQAHPDRGGTHNEAARLTAARDRLLKRSPKP